MEDSSDAQTQSVELAVNDMYNSGSASNQSPSPKAEEPDASDSQPSGMLYIDEEQAVRPQTSGHKHKR